MVPLEIKQRMKETDDGMEQSIEWMWKCTKCGNEVEKTQARKAKDDSLSEKVNKNG